MGREEEEEYVVEKIVKAVVYSKNKGNVVWKYFVKWEGYEHAENTWEPESHFAGTTLLRNFWANADYGDRDIGDASSFRKGEEIMANSRKRRQVSSSRAGTSPKQSRSTAKSKRLATTDDDDEADSAPKKRTRTSKPSSRTERVTRVKSSKGRPKISAGGPRRHSRRNLLGELVSSESDDDESNESGIIRRGGRAAQRGRHRGSWHSRSGASRREFDSSDEDIDNFIVPDSEGEEESQPNVASASSPQRSSRAQEKRPQRRPLFLESDEEPGNRNNASSKASVPPKPPPSGKPRPGPMKAPLVRYKSNTARKKRRKTNVIDSDSGDEASDASDDGGAKITKEGIRPSNKKVEVYLTRRVVTKSVVTKPIRDTSEAEIVATEDAQGESMSKRMPASEAVNETGPAPPETKTPPHRARVTRPLVKFIEDPGIMESLKAKLSKQDSNREQTSDDADSGNKATNKVLPEDVGPGERAAGLSVPTAVAAKVGRSITRPSLLTASKGKLTSKKGIYKNPNGPATNASSSNGVSSKDDGETPAMPALESEHVVDDMQDVFMEVESMPTESSIVQPPSGEELLRLTGLDGQDGTDPDTGLPDFVDLDAEAVDDDAMSGVNQHTGDVSGQNGDTENKEKDENVISSANASISGLMSFGEPVGPPANVASGTWRVGTIFEPATPISTKFGPPVSGVSTSNDVATKPTFSLRLDPSNSVTVTLKDIQPTKDDPTKSLVDVISSSQSGPPGKLFVEGVLDHVSANGSSARIAVEESANETQVGQYRQLQEQLDGGKLFIAALGNSVLVMLSSGNRTAGEKLGITGYMLGLSQTILVAQVSIENGSAYADYAMEAEDLKLS